ASTGRPNRLRLWLALSAPREGQGCKGLLSGCARRGRTELKASEVGPRRVGASEEVSARRAAPIGRLPKGRGNRHDEGPLPQNCYIGMTKGLFRKVATAGW